MWCTEYKSMWLVTNLFSILSNTKMPIFPTLCITKNLCSTDVKTIAPWWMCLRFGWFQGIWWLCIFWLMKHLQINKTISPFLERNVRICWKWIYVFKVLPYWTYYPAIATIAVEISQTCPPFFIDLCLSRNNYLHNFL